jgi:hypothetical protein
MIRAALAAALMMITVTCANPILAQGPGPRGACSPPAQNTTTFLPGPPTDSAYQVMAQVELVNLVDARTRQSSTEASKVRVRVLFPIKGVGRDETFVVDTGGGSCDEIVGLDRLGQKAFIAGRFVTDRNDRTYFVGQHGSPAR